MSPCNSYPSVPEMSHLSVPEMSNSFKSLTYGDMPDQTKTLYRRRKSLEQGWEEKESAPPAMVHSSCSMDDVRAGDSMQSLEFTPRVMPSLSYSSVASDCSESSEFYNDQSHSVAIQSCPSSASLGPTLVPIDIYSGNSELIVPPSFGEQKSEPLPSARSCELPDQNSIAKSRSMIILPSNSVRGDSAPPPETSIPTVYSSTMEEGYYTQAPDGSMEPVNVFYSEGNIVRTSEGNIVATPRLTPSMPSMSRDLSMTSNASFISCASSQSGSITPCAGYQNSLTRPTRVQSWPNLANIGSGTPMQPLVLTPSVSQNGFKYPQGSQGMVNGQPQFIYQNSINGGLQAFPPTPQHTSQITTPTVPSKPARTVTPPYHRYPNQSGGFVARNPTPIYKPNFGPASTRVMPPRIPLPRINPKKKKKNKSPTPQKKATELGPPVDRPSIGVEGGIISADEERELREIYETIEIGEWNHPEDQKTTLCLDGLGTAVKIGNIKPVLKAMKGMKRARDLGVTIPLDETSPEMNILDDWNAMKKSNDTVGIAKLAAEHGFKPEEGIRVPNHGFAYLTFNGVDGKRNAQRVYDIVNSCDKGDIKDLRCVWNPPSNSVTGKGRPAFLDSERMTNITPSKNND